MIVQEPGGDLVAEGDSALRIKKLMRAVHNNYSDEELAKYARELYDTQKGHLDEFGLKEKESDENGS